MADIEITEKQRAQILRTARGSIIGLRGERAVKALIVAVMNETASLIAKAAKAEMRKRCLTAVKAERKVHTGTDLMDFSARSTCDEIAAVISSFEVG